MAKDWLREKGEVLGLVKPPFEIGNRVKKVYGYDECVKIANNIASWASSNGYVVNSLINSTLKGKSAGQQEFFLYLIKE
jgi:predicted rRNA methylase YqxC with S4 and FtsJ domains